MNFSAVPPSTGGFNDPNSAFADALARARQIAAKISNPAGGGGGGEIGDIQGLKRPLEDSFGFSQPEAKKQQIDLLPGFAGNSVEEDTIGAQLRAIAEQQRKQQQQQAQETAAQIAAKINKQLGVPSIPATSGATSLGVTPDFRAQQAAQETAAKINQQLGLAGGPAPGASKPPLGMSGLGPHAGLGMVQNEEYRVPDKMVGLIIGRGGEQITRIQAESGCKVQIAQDSGGLPERNCTLTGTGEAIEKVKNLINEIIMNANAPADPLMMMEGQSVVEIMVPGNKVGLVIGKGGETIKQLQERAGVKMVMIQDSNVPSFAEKPLRITGDMSKCQRAREMVMDLITEKELESMQKRGFQNEYGGGSQDINVPRHAVGVVIGKKGDMIKKIQTDTGARVQFKPDDGCSPDRICSITGTPEKVAEAVNLINEQIANSNTRQEGGPGRGGFAGRGRGRGRGGFGGGGGGHFGGGGGEGFQDETTYGVPAEKCGLVIGKGGEAIREIMTTSGAHVELDRNRPPRPGEKLFLIRGDPGQIQHAIQLICEKTGMGPGPGGPPGGPGGPPGGPGGPPGGPGGYGQQPPQQPPHSYAPQGWGNAYQHWQNPSNPNDPNKAAADANAAAWQAYYNQYYNQGQSGQQAASQAPAQSAQTPAATQQSSMPAASVNPATGQADYSAAWAEYYRQRGLHNEADAILQYARQQQQQPQQPAAGGYQQQQQPATGYPQPGAYQQQQ